MRVHAPSYCSKVLSFSILALCAYAQQSPGPSFAHVAGSKVFVDPDLRVSYDGDIVHMEAYAAASATNPDLLIAGGELSVPGRRLSATEARLYRSTDAGVRWSSVPLPDEANGGWDNAVAGGVGDTAYFLTSNLDRGITVYHTNDGGKTWASTVLLAAVGWDRPHVALDVTASPYRGHFYAVGEASDGVRVMTSADSGKTFSPPVRACPQPPKWNAATTASPVVLSDGTLVVPCAPYPDYSQRATWAAADVGIVTSSDGGRTFTPYRKVGVVHRQLPPEMYLARVRGDVLLSGNFMQGPSFAVAPPGARFADRLYTTWQDIDSQGRSQLFFAWSADRGATWTAPIPVDSAGGPNSKASSLRQGVPMIAVNREGVVGIAWFDGRLATDGKGYDVFFSASWDGGRTFLPSVRVSTATSRPAQGLNIVPALDLAEPSPNGDTVIHMASPFSDRATGGDYSSMAVDHAGRFHPFWTDARNGAWQLYSATVRVLKDGRLTEPLPNACNLDSKSIQLVFGEPTWDSVTSELSVPVRLFNSSPDAILKAITVHAEPFLPKQVPVSHPAVLVPKIFDSSRSAFKGDATFVYLVSSTSPLFPSGVTVPLNWRLHVRVPEFMNFSIRAEIRSSGCPAK